MDRQLTIAGKRYRVSTRSYDECLVIRGPGLLGGITMPAGTRLDDPHLRAVVVAAIEAYKVRHQEACESLRRSMAKTAP